MAINWDRWSPADDYVKFRSHGDSVRGVLIKIDEGPDFNGNPAPRLTFKTENGTRTWTVSQANALRQLTELRPEVGWDLEVTYTSDGEGKPGRAPVKMFEFVVHSRGEAVSSASDL